MKDMYLVTNKDNTRAVDIYASSPTSAKAIAEIDYHFRPDDMLVHKRDWYNKCLNK